jgi:hypothetical protein
MPDRIRVYHPETGEPFDLPVGKANELRLEKGWLAQPLDPDAEPAVKTVETVKVEAEEREAEELSQIKRFVDLSKDVAETYVPSAWIKPKAG